MNTGIIRPRGNLRRLRAHLAVKSTHFAFRRLPPAPGPTLLLPPPPPLPPTGFRFEEDVLESERLTLARVDSGSITRASSRERLRAA